MFILPVMMFVGATGKFAKVAFKKDVPVEEGIKIAALATIGLILALLI